jgi:hypothetical protein
VVFGIVAVSPLFATSAYVSRAKIIFREKAAHFAITKSVSYWKQRMDSLLLRPKQEWRRPGALAQ